MQVAQLIATSLRENPDQWETRVWPFIQNEHLSAKIYFGEEPRYTTVEVDGVEAIREPKRGYTDAQKLVYDAVEERQQRRRRKFEAERQAAIRKFVERHQHGE